MGPLDVVMWSPYLSSTVVPTPLSVLRTPPPLSPTRVAPPLRARRLSPAHPSPSPLSTYYALPHPFSCQIRPSPTCTPLPSLSSKIVPPLCMRARRSPLSLYELLAY